MGLVLPVLLKRLNNEIESLGNYMGIKFNRIEDNAKFPIVLSIQLFNTSARASREKEIDRHRFDIVISEEYPYIKPKVQWKTEIFHPNIMMPDDGGYVCLMISENWGFDSTLTSFVIGVENLLTYPNPENPYGTASCVAAARWYLSNKPKFSAEVSYGDADA